MRKKFKQFVNVVGFLSSLATLGSFFMNFPSHLQIVLCFLCAGYLLHVIFPLLLPLHPTFSKTKKITNLFIGVSVIFFIAWGLAWFFVSNSTSYGKAENTFLDIAIPKSMDSYQYQVEAESNIEHYAVNFAPVTISDGKGTETHSAFLTTFVIFFRQPIKYTEIDPASTSFEMPVYSEATYEKYGIITFIGQLPTGVLKLNFKKTL